MATEKCPYCASKRIVFRGYRYNENSQKHLRLCKSCGRKFTLRNKYYRMRFSEEDIKRAVSLYSKGYSAAEVVLNMKRQHGIKISRWTVITWHRKYGKT